MRSLTHFWVDFVVILLSPDPSSYEMVLDGVGQGEVVVPRGGDISVLHQGVVQVSGGASKQRVKRKVQLCNGRSFLTTTSRWVAFQNEK